MSESNKYKVILPASKRPGIVRCGAHAPGANVDADAREAVRLVDVKGFVFADANDEAVARAEVDAQDKAIAAAKAAAEDEAAKAASDAQAATPPASEDADAHKPRKHKAAPAADTVKEN